MNTQAALITGASSGIGLHLAHEFARNRHPLILVAPVREELETIATSLRATYGIEVKVIARDLEQEASARDIFHDVKEMGETVDILVNNAGHGFYGQSWEIPLERDISMVRLNVEAVLRLTKLFLPPMLERGRGKILNTASVAGFEPGPNLAVYHATKAFVLSWSEALSIELEKTPVTVTALCPGPTDTDFFPKAGMIATRVFQKAAVMAPQDVAREGYEAMMIGQLFVVPGVSNKILVAARRVLSTRTQGKINMKLYEKVSPKERSRKRGDIEKRIRTKRRL